MDFELYPEDVRAILSNLPSLEHISRSLLEEICRVFKIDTTRSSAPNMLKQLKASLAELFLEKGYVFSYSAKGSDRSYREIKSSGWGNLRGRCC